MENKKYLLIGGVILLVLLSFYLGSFVNKNPQNRNFQMDNKQEMRSIDTDKNFINTKNQSSFGGVITGEIISMDGKSITLKDKNGGSRIVTLFASTTFQKTTPISINDIKVGNQISVSGQSSVDGIIKAKNIQIN